METLGRESEPLPSEKLRAVIRNLKEERSDTIEKLFYEKDKSNILPKFLENQIYAYIELIKEVEKHTTKFEYPISVAFKDDDNNVYYCINNPEENCYITHFTQIQLTKNLQKPTSIITPENIIATAENVHSS